ncbi:MAG: hypothetical protein PHX43_07395 [Alphaproteobacteria bacterium]|nr:hypothetical protein [Alphaproteobacteria bacterium]
MKSLNTLIKLQKTRVDEQRQILAKLQEYLERIEKSIVELEILRAQEQITVEENPEMGLTYGDFIKQAVIKARELEKSRQTANSAVEMARDRLALLFEEQKRYEIAAANRAAAEEKEELRRERIEMDEIGSIEFVRNKAEQS